MSDEAIPGDLYAFSDDLLLVDRYAVMTLGGIRIGKDGVQPLVALSFTGHFNRQGPDQHTVQVALSPEDTAELVRMIAESYGRARGGRDAFGRPHRD